VEVVKVVEARIKERRIRKQRSFESGYEKPSTRSSSSKRVMDPFRSDWKTRAGLEILIRHALILSRNNKTQRYNPTTNLETAFREYPWTLPLPARTRNLK